MELILIIVVLALLFCGGRIGVVAEVIGRRRFDSTYATRIEATLPPYGLDRSARFTRFRPSALAR